MVVEDPPPHHQPPPLAYSPPPPPPAMITWWMVGALGLYADEAYLEDLTLPTSCAMLSELCVLHMFTDGSCFISFENETKSEMLESQLGKRCYKSWAVLFLQRYFCQGKLQVRKKYFTYTVYNMPRNLRDLYRFRYCVSADINLVLYWNSLVLWHHQIYFCFRLSFCFDVDIDWRCAVFVWCALRVGLWVFWSIKWTLFTKFAFQANFIIRIVFPKKRSKVREMKILFLVWAKVLVFWCSQHQFHQFPAQNSSLFFFVLFAKISLLNHALPKKRDMISY